MNARLFILCLVMGTSCIFAGPVQPGDFVSPTIETYSGLSGLFASSCGGVPCQATPLTIHGNRYTTDNTTLRYFASDALCPGGDSTCTNNFSDLGFIDITLGSAAPAAGAYVNPVSGW
jgi:hypothetical protein